MVRRHRYRCYRLHDQTEYPADPGHTWHGSHHAFGDKVLGRKFRQIFWQAAEKPGTCQW